jgi:three-Cys-motif partner protein
LQRFKRKSGSGNSKGSPRVALDLKVPFSEHLFIELNQERLDELDRLRIEYESRQVRIRQGDANAILRDELLSGRIDWKTSRAVVFLDPFGMHVPWDTIQSIGGTGAVEVIINYPLGMAIQRLLARAGNINLARQEKLNAYFGDTGWQQVAYQTTNDLFVEVSHKVKDSSTPSC